ncbi:MAG: D-aminoacylase, partial [Saprospiraceae bacterium]|nr:D-aminoacylase [Saprospiraceae bacterium]
MAIFLLLAAAISCESAHEYDIVIKGGTIYDGSGKVPYIGDLAVKNDTIAAIGEFDGSAGLTIDADGKAVAPGFINMLSWANVSLLHDGRSQSDIRQGVTLEVMGEGHSMGPLNDRMKQEMVEKQGDIKFEVTWTTLGEYLRHLEEIGVSPNVTSFVGNGTVRQHVMGYENRAATENEMETMKELVTEAMREGAVGLSSSLLYVPSRYADTRELIELARVAGSHGGMYISHIRDEGANLIPSVEELIRIAREADIRSEIYHLKASGEENWHKLDTVIEMIEEARSASPPVQVTADMYTYPASSTGLNVQLPEWVREGGIEATIERLTNPETRRRILTEITFTHSPDKILLVGFRNPDLRKHIGKYLSEIAADRGQSPEETMVDLIVEDNSRIQVVYFSMSEENIRKKIQQPWMSFCSDAASYSAEGIFLRQSTHPRAYGSFARVLGKYCREEGLLTLQEAVRRLAALPARNLRLEKRGMLKPGYFADLVVFDPETVTDHATFEKPHQYATGVSDV